MGQSSESSLGTERLPLSLSQQEVWLDQRAWPGSTHLNIGGAGYIEGLFDLAIFRRALAMMVAENEALRLAPLLEGGQWLLADVEADLKIVDLSLADNPREAMREWWQAWMAEPFVLDGRPLWRFALLRHSDELHGLTIQFHHLIMDGWGTSQVMQRWATIYNALANGEAPAQTSDPGYRQFIEESLEYRNSSAFEKDAAFWQGQLPGLPLPLFDRKYPSSQAGKLPKAHLVSHAFPRQEYDWLAQCAGTLGTTLFGYLIAVLAAYFSRATGRQEIVIGLPTLNRSGKRYRETFGMFVGVFPLVVKVLPGMTVRELVDSVSLALKAAVRHQRYPISELARYLEAIRYRRASIFDVLFSYERQDYDLSFGEGRSAGSRQAFSGLARYPLGITLCEFQSIQDAELTLEANPGYFSLVEVGYIGRRLAYLMSAMAADSSQFIHAVDLVPPEEIRELLSAGTGECCGQPCPEPVFRQFEAQAAQHPSATALVWDGGTLDYANLNQWADHWAGALVESGAGPNRIVAIAMERSPEMVAALLAVSKSGAAFLPLDPDAPLARLEYILQDSKAVALMIQPTMQTRFAALHAVTLVVDPVPKQGKPLFGQSVTQPGDLAYVLFTSGSTGRPKGVMLEHAALSRRLAWISKTYGVVPEDRSGQCTQITFDPALIEFFLPLINGASVALPAPGRLSPNSLGPFAVKHGVTIMALVPSTLRGLVDSIPDPSALKLRVACCGGEVLPAELANRFIETTGARLFNVYGPTETAIFATAWPCSTQPSDATLPVGNPIDESRIYILDGDRHLQPFGVAGEVYIAGNVIARGYLNRPELDGEAFFVDPYVSGGRMYRTGDRGWLSTDGTLNFCGRLDRQIKLRGYRIELGEIESSLLAIDGVEQAAARLINLEGKQLIHAWVGGASYLAAEKIRQHLASRLPDYMLPSGISCLSELPLSTTGKIAYDLLPEPEAKAFVATARLPANGLERALLALWQAVLKRNDLSVTDNFFDVGGDSLAAVDILSGIETLMGRSVPLFLLTENPSIELIARALDAGSDQVRKSDVMLHLSRHGAGTPLYFAASGHGDLIRFQSLADVLGDACDLHMLQPPTGQSVGSIPEMAASYAEQIMDYGKPGVIAGFSVGGITALETARCLESRGFPVLSLCLVDAVFPGRLLRSAIFWRSLGWLARHLNAQELTMNGRHLGALFSDPGLLAQIHAIADYRVEAFSGEVSLIKSSGMAKWDRWTFKPWRKLFGERLHESQVIGLHGSIFERQIISGLAEAIHAVLKTAEHSAK
ncbi:MAG: amino acid adenylation domain-containing protein [Azonexus sp.]|nr:amino acid adenylation domain-containing protein [Azonexus sp.]